MWEKINNFLKGQIVTSIIYIALGACLVFMPVSTVNVICKFVFGILLILVGLYHILIYVAEKLNSTIFDLFSGGVLMVLGIFLFMNPQIVVKLLPILLGTFILVLAFTGCYASRNSMTCVYIMLAGSVLGYFLKKYHFNVPALILGLVLGPILERQFRRGMQMAQNDFFVFISRPITAIILLLVVAMYVYAFVEMHRKKSEQQ